MKALPSLIGQILAPLSGQTPVYTGFTAQRLGIAFTFLIPFLFTDPIGISLVILN